MSDDLIYLEPRQQAVLRYDDVEVHCRNVPEAWLAWAQLDFDQKVGATIEVADAIYNARAIRRLRYPEDAAAA
ncbi:MAG TPA: hypothetical protein VK438_10920 [Xanthobacteraceae bacterium]|nr:hypothetical protein [Xanthobacteraceae bacterium]